MSCLGYALKFRMPFITDPSDTAVIRCPNNLILMRFGSWQPGSSGAVISSNHSVFETLLVQ
jgi:hypothetical protein